MYTWITYLVKMIFILQNSRQNWLKKFQITRILIIMKNQSLKFFSKLWVNLKILLTLVLYVHQHDILSMHYGLPHLNTIASPWLSAVLCRMSIYSQSQSISINFNPFQSLSIPNLNGDWDWIVNPIFWGRLGLSQSQSFTSANRWFCPIYVSEIHKKVLCQNSQMLDLSYHISSEYTLAPFRARINLSHFGVDINYLI